VSSPRRAPRAPWAPPRLRVIPRARRWPGDLLDGCDPAIAAWTDVAAARDGFALLAARSPNCTFSDRAAAAAVAGIRALVVYNTIEGIYRGRSAGESETDYECGNGRSLVSTAREQMTGFQTTECALDSECESERCLLTGVVSGGSLEVCCAWDTYMTMAGDMGGVAAVFISMRDADKLRSNVLLGTSNAVSAFLYNDDEEPLIDWSAVAIWALGVLTCAYAAHRSADEARQRSRLGADDGACGSDGSDDGSPEIELSAAHAVGFIAVASGSLLVLFYVELTFVVTLAFATSAASSTAQVLARPTLEALAKLSPRVRGLLRAKLCDAPGLGPVSTLDAAAGIAGCELALWWLYVRSSAAYAWVLQDLFGVCLCVLFLDTLKVNSLKVATALLCLAFCYDIFFVFLSPYLFGASVMVRVATGPGPSRDADYCGKYPGDADCASTALPMLLMLPEFGGRGGFTMLGLGDVVLPGLLVSFAARFEASRSPPRASQKYFVLMVFGYAVGLAMANVAVALTQLGQPALLYLVPCTLGLFLAVARHDGNLGVLWRGPQALQGAAQPAPAGAYAPVGAYAQRAEAAALL